MSGSTSREFQDRLTGFLPKMRVWAMAMTRNSSAADDLVQDVAMKVLAARESFVAGSNFWGWVHRIMINHFISSVRRRREYNDLIPEVGMRAAQEDRAGLRGAQPRLPTLPKDQQEAIHLIGIED
jgi:RNA polymerase sigma-70 factor, ECF subfamily